MASDNHQKTVIDQTERLILNSVLCGVGVGARHALDFSKWVAAGVGVAATIGAGVTSAFGFYVSPFGLAGLFLVSASLGYAGAVQLCGILLLPMHEASKFGNDLWKEMLSESLAGNYDVRLDTQRLNNFGRKQPMTRFQKKLFAHLEKEDREGYAGELLRQMMLVRRLLIGQVATLLSAFAAVLAGAYYLS